MSIRDEAHFEVPSVELAAWIERQGDQWWTVDGDPLLAGRLSLPCPSDELAALLRRINRPLLVQDCRHHPEGKGEVIRADKLEELAIPWSDNAQAAGNGKPPRLRTACFTWLGRARRTNGC